MAKGNKRNKVMQQTAFAELMSCKCWPVAEARLREGASAKSVSEYIHGMGELTEIKVQSLARQLSRYKNKVLQVKQTLSPLYVDKIIRSLDMTVDDVDELTKLILVQKKRIGKDLELEERMPKLAPWVGKEIQLLFDMIERRARLLQTLGVLYKAPEKHAVALFGDDTWARLLDTLDDKQRTEARKIVQMEYMGTRSKEDLEDQELRRKLIEESDEDEF